MGCSLMLINSCKFICVCQGGMDLKPDGKTTAMSRSSTSAGRGLAAHVQPRDCTFPDCCLLDLERHERIPADSPCSEEGCAGWCHYDPCYTRFCDASEFYPGLDKNPLRDRLMVTFCYDCALTLRAEFREEADAKVVDEADTDYDSQATQNWDFDEYDSQATQVYEPYDNMYIDPIG